MANGVEFDDEKSSYAAVRPQQKAGQPTPAYNPAFAYGAQPRGFSAWLIKHHIAKSEKMSQVIMLCIVIINFIIIGIVIKFFLF